MNAAAIVLAAGAGARLGGVCKAALVVPDGRTFARAVVEVARAAGCTDVVVVAGPPHEAATRAAVAALGALARVVVNPDPARGMASSLAIGLAALDPGRGGSSGFARRGAEGPLIDVALAWPVDHAFVGRDAVAAILAAAGPDVIVVPEHGGRGGHPTAFGRAFFAGLAASVATGGARAVIAAAGPAVHRVAADASVLRDVDLPEDLRDLPRT